MDELCEFMDTRGTPITRLPVLAGKNLDLFELYKQVCSRGGMLEVINKKLWQDVIRGLKLPTVTSGAYTLRTQYSKLLYPFECAKKKFSRLEDLQFFFPTLTPEKFANKTKRKSSIQNKTTPLEPMENLSTSFGLGVFEQTSSPLNSMSSQQSLLAQCLKIMEEQKKLQERASLPLTPRSIKREREDDEDCGNLSKKSTITFNSDKQKETSSLFGGVQFDLKRNENGQLQIHLRLDGVQYESDLRVVS